MVMSRPAPRACSSPAGPLASNARDNVFCRARWTNLFFDAVRLQVIRCGCENDEKAWDGDDRGERLDIYLSTWDTTMVGGTEAGEMVHAYDQVAFINWGDLTTMRLVLAGVMTV